MLTICQTRGGGGTRCFLYIFSPDSHTIGGYCDSLHFIHREMRVNVAVTCPRSRLAVAALGGEPGPADAWGLLTTHHVVLLAAHAPTAARQPKWRGRRPSVVRDGGVLLRPRGRRARRIRSASPGIARVAAPGLWAHTMLSQGIWPRGLLRNRAHLIWCGLRREKRPCFKTSPRHLSQCRTLHRTFPIQLGVSAPVSSEGTSFYGL